MHLFIGHGVRQFVHSVQARHVYIYLILKASVQHENSILTRCNSQTVNGPSSSLSPFCNNEMQFADCQQTDHHYITVCQTVQIVMLL